MTAKEWFRNKDWNPEIEAYFFEKLRKARRKEQYLRIQASYLANRHPEAALTLLEKYSALPDKFDLAQALVDQASAYLSLGRMEKAVSSLLSALEREREFPNLKTQAWSEYALLVAQEKLAIHYEKALQVLEENRSWLTFPVDKFCWNAAFALIEEARGNLQKCAPVRELRSKSGRPGSFGF